MQIAEMIKTHPKDAGGHGEALEQCIAACYECGQTCNACADACLAEDNVAEMRECIRLNLDCADLCFTTGRTLSRLTSPDKELLKKLVETLATSCRKCGEECDSHAEKMAHCGVCAESCRKCEAACEALGRALS